MGPVFSVDYVILDDAAAVYNETLEVGVLPLSDDAAALIGEFSRSTGGPDVDVYSSGDLFDGEAYIAAVYPSFFVFEETYDVGDVTIEVLDNLGNLYNYTQIDLPSNSSALAAVEFVTDRSGFFLYRLTAESGTTYGEYTLIQHGEIDDGGPSLSKRKGTRDMQSSADIVSPYQDVLPYGVVYSQEVIIDQVEKLLVNGAALTRAKESNNQPRFAFYAGVLDTINMKSTVTGSSLTEVQYYILSEYGEVLETQNVTLPGSGELDIQFTPPDVAGYLLVMRLDDGASVETQTTYATSSVVTYNCLRHDGATVNPDCQADNVVLKGFVPGQLVALEVTMRGDANGNSEGAIFTDATSSKVWGLVHSGLQCTNELDSAGAVIVSADGNGDVAVSWTVPSEVNFCEPVLVMNIEATPLDTFLFPETVASPSTTATTTSQCADPTCSEGTFAFDSSSDPLEIKNMTVLMHGFIGDKLTLTFDGVQFYNQTFSVDCVDGLQTFEVPIGASLAEAKFPATIAYNIEGAVNCTDRQSLMLGALAFGPDPNSGSANSGNDALAAGLGGFAAFLVVCALALVYYRSSRKPVTSNAEISTKTI